MQMPEPFSKISFECASHKNPSKNNAEALEK
jgi:hypothetical protein